MMRPVFLFAIALSCAGADLYPVAGVVTNALTKSPIPHAQVYITRTGNPRGPAPYITGEDGRFSFELPAGSYALHAGTRMSTGNYGAHNPDSPLGSAVIVGPGKDTSHLIFRYFPTASISGKVLDDNGEPVEGATVQLLRSSVVAGRRTVATWRWDRTNDLGEYRFGWITGGARYFVVVTGEPWYSKRNVFQAQPEESSAAYAAAVSPEMALAPGSEEHYDFSLRTVVGARVRGKTDAPAGSTGLVSLMYTGPGGTDAYQQQQNLIGGTMGTALAGVPPGEYVLRVTASHAGADLIGTKTISVNGSEVNADVSMHPVASVSGRLQFTESSKKPASTVVVGLTKAGTSYAASVHADGTFHFANVLPGKYQALVRSPAGYLVLNQQSYDVGDGDSASVNLTLTDEAGALSGYVKSGDQPVGGVLAVLAPAAGSKDLATRAFQTESDGSYDFRNIAAGNYLLFAIEDTGIEYAVPEVVKPWLAKAKPIRIEAHKTVSEDVVLTVTKP